MRHVFFCWVVWMGSGAVCLGDAQDASPKQRAIFVTTGFRDGRARLASGVFRAHGTIAEKGPSGALEGKVEVFSAFDFTQKLMRFDREHPVWVAPAADEPPGELTLGKSGGKFVSTKELSIHWELGASVAKVLAPEGIRSYAKPFDVRLLGITNIGQLSAGDSQWDTYVDRLNEWDVGDALIEGEGHHRISWIHAKNNVRIEVVFDGGRDFVPVHYGLHVGPPAANGRWPEASEVASLKWIRVKEVWVPSSMVQEKKGRRSSRRELTFEWVSVNEPVEDALFTWQGLNLPVGVRVDDQRLGKPITLGVVSSEDVVDRLEVRRGPWVWVVTTVMAVSAMVVMWWWWWWTHGMRRGTPKGSAE